MKKTILFSLLILGFISGIKAQEVIIGNGTTSDYDIAFYPYYEDSWWESIYLSTEIGMQGLITSVALQSGSGPGLQCDDVRIYLGMRSSNSYSSTSDWTPASALTLVYSGTNVTIGGSNGWENYTLQNPFMYDGSSNLVVVFAKHASDYSSDAVYYYTSTDNYQSLYRYMDDDPTYAQHPGSNSGSRSFYHPNLKLNITPNANYCGAVNGLQVTDITTDAATVSWNVPFNPHSYILQVKTDSQTWNDPAVNTYTTTDTFYTVTGLNPSTTYNVRVANDCVVDTSNYTLTSFSTLCVPTSNLPISEDFDSYTHSSNQQTGANNLPHCWDALNTGSSYTSYPYVYYNTNNANSGNYSLRFYTGSNNQYADQYAFLPALDISMVNIQDLFLSFNMRRNANNTPFTLVIGVTSGTDISTLIAVDTLTVSNTTYAYKEISFSDYVGNGDRIVIKAPKPSSGNNRGYIDDIVLNYSYACRMVSDVTISDITTTEANISWQSHGTETAWLIEYREAGDNPWQTEYASSNPYLLSNLNAATTYQVRVSADCSSEYSEASAIASFSTENCDTADRCIYTFNLTDSYGDGWNGSSLRVQQGGLTVTSMTVSTNAEYAATFQVGLCDNIPITLVWNSGSNSYDDECSFEVVNPFGETIYTTSYPSAGTLTTFNVSCTPPVCPRPSSVTISNIGDVSATISWVSTGTETDWNIEYRPLGNTAWTTEAVSTNPYTLTGLTALTEYEVRVQADCGSGDVSDWRETTFHTAGCDTTSQCDYTFSCNDSFGDGWNDAILIVQQNGVTIATITVNDDEYSNIAHVLLCDNIPTTLIWTEGDFDEECSFTVTNPFGETIYTSGSLSGGTLFSFTSHCTPPTCPTPVTISVSNIGNTSANASWTAGGTETNWILEYKEASSSNWTSVLLTSTTYTITGLTAGTNYDVRVQADCGGGDLSDWRESTFRTNLCEVSEQCTYTVYLTGEYDDSWEDNSVTIMQNGIAVATIVNNDYSVTVSVSLCDGVSTSLVFNEGGYFADECSMILYAPDGSQQFYQADMSYYTTYTFTTNCSGSTPPSTCDVPTGLATANITYNAADVNWSAGGSETAWNLQYKLASASDWGSNYLVTAATYHISGLAAQTTYQVRVQAICGDATSEWTAPASFTTPTAPADPCDAPSNLQIANITQNSATMTWSAGGSETAWKVGYKLSSASQWQEATVQTTTYLIEGLTANSTYDVRVKAVCAADNQSDFVSTSFTTTGVGIDNITLANSISLMPNPADNYIELRVNCNVTVTEAVVYNAFGQMIQTVQLTDNHARIDLSNVAAGMYFVRVNGEGVMATKKFIRR